MLLWNFCHSPTAFPYSMRSLLALPKFQVWHDPKDSRELHLPKCSFPAERKELNLELQCWSQSLQDFSASKDRGRAGRKGKRRWCKDSSKTSGRRTATLKFRKLWSFRTWSRTFLQQLDRAPEWKPLQAFRILLESSLWPQPTEWLVATLF